jgi:hypothetical protein
LTHGHTARGLRETFNVDTIDFNQKVVFEKQSCFSFCNATPKDCTSSWRRPGHPCRSGCAGCCS